MRTDAGVCNRGEQGASMNILGVLDEDVHVKVQLDSSQHHTHLEFHDTSNNEFMCVMPEELTNNIIM